MRDCQVLTAKKIEHLTEPGRYLDSDGLYLLIGKTGSKSWMLRYQLDGRRRDMGLGAFPVIGLKEARTAAMAARTQCAHGVDPIEARSTRQRAAKAEGVTFEQVAREYHAEHCKHLTPGRSKGWLSLMERFAFPVMGKLSPAAVDTEQVLRVLRPLWSTKPPTANELRGYLERVLDMAKSKELRTGENPARWRGHLDNLLSRTDKKRAKGNASHPSMPYAEVPKFVATLGADRDAQAMRLVILTAARAGMVRLAVWDEFDLDAGVWSLPAERMKTGQPFRVPLSRQAVALLQSIERTSEYVFPGYRGAMHENAFFNLMKDTDYVTHGFRASFRTWASEKTHYARQLAELSLAHDERSSTESAYDRTDLLEKRRPLMQDWADHCCAVPNVIRVVFDAAR